MCVCYPVAPHKSHHTSSDFNDDQKGQQARKLKIRKTKMFIQYINVITLDSNSQMCTSERERREEP